ncbi:CAMK/CAMKL protein kinase [Phytophthora nicotianae P1976]|uniref:CAMK/CAMKL protein kinase n=1 Tax=Phytophthora nicotianae P1976 TaxID=1317066 RepID=A0A081AZC1_PHYNI|nr:CAMK/CAMKL protein kinase [Phytophthora nicotianae P1976]
MTNGAFHRRADERWPPLSPNPFTLSRRSGGRGIVSLVFSQQQHRTSQRRQWSLHLRTELESDTSRDDVSKGLGSSTEQAITCLLRPPNRGRHWLSPMAARSPLQQRSSESSITDRTRTSSGSGSTRVTLTRRLTKQVYVGAMEVPPDAVGIDKPAPGQLTVAVKVRALTLDSDRNGGGGLRTWQEWRTVQRLLALEREADNYVLCASSALSRNRSNTVGRSVLDGRRHIVRYYTTSVESESFRLIMEHCPGGDLLSQLISRGALGPQPSQRVSQQEARRWVLQLARGLRYLHASGIAHRDLCPENILISRAGDVKICNFGASTTRAAELSRDRVAGNLHYTAPEAVSGTWYDPVRADVWSLGAVFFVLLTGSPLLRLPFPECRGFELVKTVGCRGVLKLWNMDQLFSAATMDLLAKMLTVDPAKRLGSMREVLEHPAMLATAHTERSLIAV